MSENRMVAVCDILGYSNLVREHSLQKIIDYHVKNILNIIKSSIPKYGETMTSPTQLDLMRTGMVGHVAFSDTVIIYSLNDDRDGRKNVLDAVYRLLCIPMNTPYYRYRVGISYGEMYVDREEGIYIGKALIEAHDLEVMQEWSGAALTESAANMFRDYYPENSILVDYDVPIKGDTTKRLTVVNWISANHEKAPTKRNWMWREEEGERVSYYKNPEIERKLQNTETFHLDKCYKCYPRET